MAEIIQPMNAECLPVTHPENLCICCGKSAPYTWFCNTCERVKEQAYAQCRDEKITDYVEVIRRRDKALSENLKNG